MNRIEQLEARNDALERALKDEQHQHELTKTAYYVAMFFAVGMSIAAVWGWA